MLKSIQKNEDAKKLRQLILKFRKGEECSAAETWFVYMCLTESRGMTKDVMELLSRAEEGKTARDAWLWVMVIRKNNFSESKKILSRHQQDPLCASLFGCMTDFRKGGSSHLQLSADAGCAEGLYWLGRSYLGGFCGRPDEIAGLELLKRAAKMGHPGALVIVAKKVGVSVSLEMIKQAGSWGSIAAIYDETIYWIDRTSGPREANLRRAAALSRRRYAMGGYVDHLMRRIHAESPSAVVPWGQWCPDAWLQQWMSDEMHARMFTLLLMHASKGTLCSRLPKHLVLDICFWICTDPPQYELPN